MLSVSSRCFSNSPSVFKPKATTFRVALEWTPNTNHIGFFVARANGYYSSNNLNVELISPDIDNYTLTPGRRAISGQCEFAMGPTESAISSATTESHKMRLLAVAALLQTNTSAVVTLKSSNINNINDIRNYASYDGRFEMDIIREMIKFNGGDAAQLNEVQPMKLDIWPNLMNNLVHKQKELNTDSTWVFMQWEGVEATILNNMELNVFKLEEYGIPYGYTPILMARQDVLDKNDINGKYDQVVQFLECTKQGYEYAADMNNIDEVCDILIEDSGKHASIANKRDLIYESMKYLIQNNCFLSEKDGQWGKMELTKWNLFLDWMCEKNIIKRRDGSIVSRNEINAENLLWMDPNSLV